MLASSFFFSPVAGGVPASGTGGDAVTAEAGFSIGIGGRGSGEEGADWGAGGSTGSAAADRSAGAGTAVFAGAPSVMPTERFSRRKSAPVTSEGFAAFSRLSPGLSLRGSGVLVFVIVSQKYTKKPRRMEGFSGFRATLAMPAPLPAHARYIPQPTLRNGEKRACRLPAAQSSQTQCPSPGQQALRGSAAPAQKRRLPVLPSVERAT